VRVCKSRCSADIGCLISESKQTLPLVSASLPHDVHFRPWFFKSGMAS
jgi:hypothetical protein